MIHISPTNVATVNASGESIWMRIGARSTPKPASVSRRPTALSGRRRQATRPHAAKETPESVWITSFPGTGGPRSKSTGISAMTLAAATAAHSASQNAAPCVRRRQVTEPPEAAARDRTGRELARSTSPAE